MDWTIPCKEEETLEMKNALKIKRYIVLILVAAITFCDRTKLCKDYVNPNAVLTHLSVDYESILKESLSFYAKKVRDVSSLTDLFDFW